MEYSFDRFKIWVLLSCSHSSLSNVSLCSWLRPQRWRNALWNCQIRKTTDEKQGHLANKWGRCWFLGLICYGLTPTASPLQHEIHELDNKVPSLLPFPSSFLFLSHPSFFFVSYRGLIHAFLPNCRICISPDILIFKKKTLTHLNCLLVMQHHLPKSARCHCHCENVHIYISAWRWRHHSRNIKWQGTQVRLCPLIQQGYMIARLKKNWQQTFSILEWTIMFQQDHVAKKSLNSLLCS